jgi:excisionase family DNA binding protein
VSLDASIQHLVGEAVRASLERELPTLLAKFEQPPDPAKTFTVKEAAEFLSVTPTCIRERLRDGSLHAIRLGKYSLIPYQSIRDLVLNELERARLQKDQEQRAREELAFEDDEIDDDIAEALGLTTPSVRKARPARRA